MKDTRNLYRVTVRGMRDSHGTCYVVAQDAGEAYQAFRKYLDDHDLGFAHDRVLDRVELAAESHEFPATAHLLLASPSGE